MARSDRLYFKKLADIIANYLVSKLLEFYWNGSERCCNMEICRILFLMHPEGSSVHSLIMATMQDHYNNTAAADDWFVISFREAIAAG